MPRKTQPPISAGSDADSESPLEASEEQRQRDVGDLGAGDPGAEAHVHALAESQVRLDLALDVEALSVGPHVRVAVGREDADAELRAGRQPHPRENRVARHLPRVQADRRDPADRLVEHRLPQRRIRLGRGALLRVIEKRPRRHSERVPRLVETAADRHLDVGADALDRHLVVGDAQERRQQGVVGVRLVPAQHLVEGDVDLIERALARGPHIGIVGVVSRRVDHRLRPALQVFLRRRCAGR